jgi:hypothetical protein
VCHWAFVVSKQLCVPLGVCRVETGGFRKPTLVVPFLFGCLQIDTVIKGDDTEGSLSMHVRCLTLASSEKGDSFSVLNKLPSHDGMFVLKLEIVDVSVRDQNSFYRFSS